MMDEHDEIVVNYALKRFEIFCQQNLEEGHFDVTFEFVNRDATVELLHDNNNPIPRQQLYAHSFVLWPLSKVFERTFFGPFAKSSVITIERHSYNDFKEFLSFLYSGYCDINEKNLMAMIDLSEYYDIKELKEICDVFLKYHPFETRELLGIYESVKLYNGLQDGMLSIWQSISTNAAEIITSNAFMDAKKETILDIVKMDDLKVSEEVLFKAVMEWAGDCSYRKVSEEIIKLKLKDILPFIRFPIMNMDFLLTHVVPKGYLFSSFDELSCVLRDAAGYGSSAIKYSKYSNKLRQGQLIQFRDSSGYKAFAYLQNRAAINAIQDASKGKYHGALTWDFDVPEIGDDVGDRIYTNVFGSRCYVIWEDYRFVLKDYKSTQPFYRKDFDDELWFFKNFQVLTPLTLGNPNFNLSDHNITVKVV
uniref:BTB domain-containing protein n=1 Tax=Panagrolaimus sp. PS1159 TaxID=55785 RepID=A0AC35F9R7_9BILA